MFVVLLVRACGGAEEEDERVSFPVATAAVRGKKRVLAAPIPASCTLAAHMTVTEWVRKGNSAEQNTGHPQSCAAPYFVRSANSLEHGDGQVCLFTAISIDAHGGTVYKHQACGPLPNQHSRAHVTRGRGLPATRASTRGSQPASQAGDCWFSLTEWATYARALGCRRRSDVVRAHHNSVAL